MVFPYQTDCDINLGVELYDGDWLNDLIEGNGVYLYSNGDKYEGEFRQNLHHGKGAYYCIDGSKYVGEFENHKMHELEFTQT